MVGGQRVTEVGVEPPQRFNLFSGSRHLPALGDEEGLFLLPDQDREGPVQQHAGGARIAEGTVRKAFDQGQEAVTLQYIVGRDLESRQKLETGLDQAGTYIL